MTYGSNPAERIYQISTIEVGVFHDTFHDTLKDRLSEQGFEKLSNYLVRFAFLLHPNRYSLSLENKFDKEYPNLTHDQFICRDYLRTIDSVLAFINIARGDVGFKDGEFVKTFDAIYESVGDDKNLQHYISHEARHTYGLILDKNRHRIAYLSGLTPQG